MAALALGDIKKAGQLMEQDQYHEPYREKLVPHLTTLRQIGHQIGAYATYLSGAGKIRSKHLLKQAASRA